jgi:hypothetical protein
MTNTVPTALTTDVKNAIRMTLEAFMLSSRL